MAVNYAKCDTFKNKETKVSMLQKNPLENISAFISFVFKVTSTLGRLLL